MKKMVSCTVAAIIALAPVSASAIDVSIDNVLLKTDVPASSINNRTMVPMRAIFEALGADVAWDSVSKSVFAQKGGTTVNLCLNQSMAYVNNVPYMLDSPPVSINGRTMVPVRFVAESLDCDVKWDGKSQKVIISTNSEIPFYGNGLNGALNELNDIYKNEPNLSYNKIRSSANSEKIAFAISYNSSVSNSEYIELLNKAVENVLAISKKYNVDIFSIEVCLDTNKDSQDIYWHSYNLTSDREKSKVGDFFYLSKGIEKRDVSYTDVKKILKIGSNTPDKKESYGITMEAYNAIKNGMTLKQVQEIIGYSGYEQASTDGGLMQTWSSTGSSGTYKEISVIFIDGEVYSKSQYGL